MMVFLFFFKQKTAYEMRISDWSSDVCSSDLIEYAPFNDPDNGRSALLVECGQHWARSAGEVALDTALYFLKALDVIDPAFAEAHLTVRQPPRQRMMDVTDGVAAATDDFRFVKEFGSCEQFPKAGAIIAVDGGRAVHTPYVDVILLMANHHAQT